MMNLKTDLEKNKETTIISFNIWVMLAIFIILSVATCFLSIPLGIGFTAFSVAYLIFIFAVKNKFKNIKKENEELPEKSV